MRFIDPRGLASMGDYVDCLAERAAGDPMRDCNMVLFATATDSATKEIQEICKVVGEAVVCTAVCTLKEVLGANIQEFAINSHKGAAKRALDKIAKETASKFVKKAIPVVNVIDTVSDTYGTAVCTVNCVKK
jgi:hypothetical protein